MPISPWTARITSNTLLRAGKQPLHHSRPREVASHMDSLWIHSHERSSSTAQAQLGTTLLLYMADGLNVRGRHRSEREKAGRRQNH